MAEQRRNSRNTKSTKVQPVNDYGRIQPQAPELEEAVEALCVEYFEGDAGLCAYLQCAVADMAVRLKADSLY